MIARNATDGLVSELQFAVTGLVALAILAFLFNIKNREAPGGSNKVPLMILSMRGIAAGLAIGICLILADSGLPFIAGLASAFPAIFLTSMVALWISQGSQVPKVAAAPMIMGGAIMELNLRSRLLMYFGNATKSVLPYMWLYRFFAFIIMPNKNHRESRVLFIR